MLLGILLPKVSIALTAGRMSQILNDIYLVENDYHDSDENQNGLLSVCGKFSQVDITFAIITLSFLSHLPRLVYNPLGAKLR